MARELKLVASTRINGIQVSRGDILREDGTQKTVKVLNVFKEPSGQDILEVEYNGTSDTGGSFYKSADFFRFLS
jgi:hypothetical protein